MTGLPKTNIFLIIKFNFDKETNTNLRRITMAEFGTLDIGDVENEGKRLNSKGNFSDQFVPIRDMKVGESLPVRILPPVKGGKLFQYNRIHSINNRSVPCPRPLVNGKWDRNVPCPICDHYTSLWQKIDALQDEGKKAEAEELMNEARGLRPNERYYYNAIVRKMIVNNEAKTNVGPRVLSIGKVLHQMIIRAIASEDETERLGDVTNVKNGYDFVIRKDMRSNFPNYDRSDFAKQPSPLCEPEQVEKIAENMVDLTKFRIVKPLEELRKELAIHRGLIPDDSMSFDADKFDAEFKNETSESGTVGKSTVAPAEEAEATAPLQDVALNDAELMADLAEFQEQE